MSITCQITFENREKVFYSGQVLRGTAYLTLTKETKVTSAYVRILGRAHAYWTVRHCNINRSTFVLNSLL